MTPTAHIIEHLLDTVRRGMRRHEMVLGGESILVAVSGGVDSTVLLDVLARLAPSLRLTISVAHFDHGLRESSAEDAEFVRELARQRGLKAYVGKGEIERVARDERRSIEDVARQERYDFLERIARRHRYRLVATGHTADDNAETLVMNLLRGTGVTGLAGIPPTRRLSGSVILARPLLEVMRSEVEAYAEQAGIQWRQDETNDSVKFTRNRIRHEVMPLLKDFNPSIVSTLNETAELMRGFDHFLSGAVDAAMKSAVVGEPQPNERVELDARHITHLLPVLRGEVIQRVMRETFFTPPLPKAAVERALELLWKDTGSRANLGGRFEALRDREKIVLLKRPPVIRDVDKSFAPGETVQAGEITIETTLLPNQELRFTSNRNVEFISADRLGERLTLRSWRDGDRFRPLGMKGEKKISDFLVDTKVPLDKKREVLVVADGDTIIWVCGMRIDHRFKVEKETKNVLKFELHKT